MAKKRDVEPAESLDDLTARSEGARQDAEAAIAEANRMADAAARIQAEAQAKIDEANEQAEEAEREVARLQKELADANAAAKAAEARAVEAEAADVNGRAAAAKAEADAAAAEAERQADLIRPKNTVRLEGGGFVQSKYPLSPREFRVYGIDGKVYDHVSEHPATGDWVYRNQG